MIFSQAWGQLSHGKQMSSLSHENSSRYWQEYKMETSTGAAVIVFICHISMQPHIYCGRYQRAWCIACPTALSKFFQSDPAHPHAPLLHFYKWTLSVAAAVSHPRHAEWDATARDIIKVSPEHVGGGGSVSSSHRLSFTNTNRCFLMRSHANLLTSAVVFNTVRVKQCLQRWRS